MASAVLQSSRAVGRHNDSLFSLASVGEAGGVGVEGGGAVERGSQAGRERRQ